MTKHELGIPIRSNTEYVAATAGGITILHFLLPPIFCVVGIGLIILWFICVAPAGIVALATHHSHAGKLPVTILLILGTLLWIYLSWRICRKIWRWFVRRTRYRFVDGYRGPLAPITDRLNAEAQRRSTPTSSSSPRTPRR